MISPWAWKPDMGHLMDQTPVDAQHVDHTFECGCVFRMEITSVGRLAEQLVQGMPAALLLPVGLLPCPLHKKTQAQA